MAPWPDTVSDPGLPSADQPVPRVDTERLLAMLAEAVPWIAVSGLEAVALEEGHAAFRLPSTLHRDPFGTVHAAALFMLMEITGAALFACTHPLHGYLLAQRETHLRFLERATSDLLCEVVLPEEKAREMILPIETKGKGEWAVDLECRDAGGRLIAEGTCRYYVKRIR